ncbi:MAG: chemotaxis protein CheW [Gemmatimonadota bacterium]|nr:MAG: chemotaxis protein CheW [Gemmatimonadota bacterium]
MSDSARRQLLVEVGEFLLAAAADEVREVMDPTEATPVPGAVPGVLGLINRRGKIIVAGELGAFLGLSSEPGEESALVVFADGDRRIALLVDRVLGVGPDRDGDLDVGSDLLEALGARDLVAGVGQSGPRPYLRLDVPAIFARVLDQVGDQDRSVRPGSAG